MTKSNQKSSPYFEVLFFPIIATSPPAGIRNGLLGLTLLAAAREARTNGVRRHQILLWKGRPSAPNVAEMSSSHLTKSFQCSETSASSVSTADTRARSIVGSQRKFWINRIPGLYVIDRGARDYPLPPCTWTSSHKDSKQPRQSFNHSRYAHRNTVQITRMMALKGEGGGEGELQDTNIYVHVRSLEGFVIESSLPINEAIFCSTQYIFSSVCPPAELWQIDAGPVYLFIRHPGD